MDVHAILMRISESEAVVMDKLKSIKFWIWINIVCMGLYLYTASWVWPSLNVKDFPAGTGGDPIVWGLGAGIVLFTCSSVNLIWLIRILLLSRRDKNLWPICAWLFFVLSWVVVNRYDYYMQHNVRQTQMSEIPEGVQAVLE